MSLRPIAISDRDRALLGVLGTKVKALTFPQIRRTWWTDCVSGEPMCRRLKRLQQSGLVNISRMLAFGEVHLKGPVSVWKPNVAMPDFRAIIAQTKGRWSQPLRSIDLVEITTIGAAMFGGRARRVRPSEATHDVHLSQVFLRKRSNAPQQADAWISESQFVHDLGGTEGVVPDALVRMDSEDIAIEVIGESYVPSKLECFHHFCRRRGWSYELW